MGGNTFGTAFRLTTFGESHGPAIGGIIDGCPAGLQLDLEGIRTQMNRRRPGQSAVTSTRNEKDNFEILSGIYKGKTLGSPIGFIIRNLDYLPSDYDSVSDTYRPSHADYTYAMKYGHRDPRGGGRSSARETAARVFGGALATQFLMLHNIRVVAFVSQVGNIELTKNYMEIDPERIESNPMRCPDESIAAEMMTYIEKLRKEGDSTGGTITCYIQNLPPGIGEPVFDKLQADLAKACMSINAAHGFEYGSGFAGASMKGSEHNDLFEKDKSNRIVTGTNYSGGIQGGISNGMDVYFRIAFKPVSTIKKEQRTVNTAGESVLLSVDGRHDPCVVPRAVPIVEAMTSLVIADLILLNRLSRVDATSGM